ncbi:DNA-directed primase/polymerase protein [Ditylenchus destructor]|uniref:DNA-directed primase/polymerase protein n=1 Tax=Ditylenchus destructor TaxID=166010 RepID=A0AAD4RAB3_9BILA|nr:DNA-directed primase/polymerase protein [Ditylenchus destructor]
MPKKNYATEGGIERQLKANGFAVFNHQNEAFSRLDLKKNPNRRIFTFEISRHVPGSRKFVCSDIRTFADWYLAPTTSRRNFHEVILENTPCRLFLDLEYIKALNMDIDLPAMMANFLDVCAKLLTSFIGEPVNIYDFLILESSTEEKFSAHVIVHLPNGRVFSSVKDLKVVLTRLIQQLDAENVALINSPQSRNRFLCDTTIYTKNRNFRLYLSSKIAYNTPLSLAEYCSFYHGKAQPSQEDIFMDSLIIPEDFHTFEVIDLGRAMKATSVLLDRTEMKNNDKVRANGQRKGRGKEECPAIRKAERKDDIENEDVSLSKSTTEAPHDIAMKNVEAKTLTKEQMEENPKEIVAKKDSYKSRLRKRLSKV